ncbi:MAG: fibronectin type III domain-containing protein [Acidobacteriota bacterium]|nr:fibronectin type III domain-containing protein [Acidobacteriota bacterium]
MSRRSRERWQRDWYKIDVDAVRGVFLVLLMLAVGYLAYVSWGKVEERYARGKYQRVMLEARSLQRSLRGTQGLSDFADEYNTARESLQTAEGFGAEGRWEPALRSAERGRSLLASVLAHLQRAETSGQAQFISVSSGVEFRRGERGDWQRAFSRGVLYAGDYVKTESGGSAEIMGIDGTVYTVRSETVILIGRTTGLEGKSTQRSISLTHGWVSLSTARTTSTVATPEAKAEVNEGSSALVAYDGTRRVGRFATYSGTMDVASSTGQRRNLRQLEQVVQTGRALSEKRRLPAAPLPVDPGENLELSMDDHDRVVLSWQPVPGAKRYALQVGRNRLFVRNIIDVEDRSSTRATLGLRGDGLFLWRVAAISDGGVMGPWSTARRFRVTRPAAEVEDEPIPTAGDEAAG